MLSGMSWKANWSIEKSQKLFDAGENRTDFLLYLLPRLFPSCYSKPLSLKAIKGCMTYPDVVSLLDEHEWQTAFLLGHTNPNLTVHEKTMMQIDHSFLSAAFACIDSYPFLAFPQA